MVDITESAANSLLVRFAGILSKNLEQKIFEKFERQQEPCPLSRPVLRFLQQFPKLYTWINKVLFTKGRAFLIERNTRDYFHFSELDRFVYLFSETFQLFPNTFHPKLDLDVDLRRSVSSDPLECNGFDQFHLNLKKLIPEN